MQTCIDTCCLINLINSGLVERTLAHSWRRMQFQGLVEDEIAQHKRAVDNLVASGLITPLSGAAILASEVGIIASQYNLGLGESECIAICVKTGCALASDDGKARRTAKAVVGESRVTGSIGLILEAVKTGSISPAEAAIACDAMRTTGGFLPKLTSRFFEEALI